MEQLPEAMPDMSRNYRTTRCRAEWKAAARPAFLIAVAAMAFGLAACGEADGPQAETAAAAAEQAPPLAPYNGMAMVPAAPVDDDPDQLLGLTGDAIAGKLGKPALIRRDGAAEVWQYRRVRCVLDLFLYGSERKVEHVDLRDRGDATQEAVRDCFVRMLQKAPASS